MAVFARSSSSLLVVVVVVVLTLCVGQAQSGLWQSRGACPEGVGKNETWFPEDEDCAECTCFGPGEGFSCAGCGLAMIQLDAGCYQGKSHPEEPYPTCCKVKQFCPGDEGFDESLVKELPNVD